jgi:hypothetical protein
VLQPRAATAGSLSRLGKVRAPVDEAADRCDVAQGREIRDEGQVLRIETAGKG